MEGVPQSYILQAAELCDRLPEVEVGELRAIARALGLSEEGSAQNICDRLAKRFDAWEPISTRKRTLEEEQILAMPLYKDLATAVDASLEHREKRRRLEPEMEVMTEELSTIALPQANVPFADVLPMDMMNEILGYLPQKDLSRLSVAGYDKVATLHRTRRWEEYLIAHNLPTNTSMEQVVQGILAQEKPFFYAAQLVYIIPLSVWLQEAAKILDAKTELIVKALEEIQAADSVSNKRGRLKLIKDITPELGTNGPIDTLMDLLLVALAPLYGVPLESVLCIPVQFHYTLPRQSAPPKNLWEWIMQSYDVLSDLQRYFNTQISVTWYYIQARQITCKDGKVIKG